MDEHAAQRLDLGRHGGGRPRRRDHAQLDGTAMIRWKADFAGLGMAHV
jgi:hypothetical protein